MLIKLRYAAPNKAREISVDVPSVSAAYDGLSRKTEIVADNYSVAKANSSTESLIVRIPQTESHRELLASSVCRGQVQKAEVSASVGRDSMLLISNNRSELLHGVHNLLVEIVVRNREMPA